LEQITKPFNLLKSTIDPE